MWRTRVIRVLWLGLATAAIVGEAGCCCCGEKKIETEPDPFHPWRIQDQPGHLTPERIRNGIVTGEY